MEVSRRRATAALIAAASAACLPLAQAQDKFPSRPIRLVVPFAAGGPGDILARLVATEMHTHLGQPVVVDNRPGASGETGTEQVAKSPADGYTILQTSTVLTVSMALRDNLRYDLLRDFEPVTYAFEAPLVLVTPGSSPHKTVASLIAYAKRKPEGLTYGTGGVGTVGHLTAELFKRRADIAAVNVPYKGNGAAMADLIGGRLDFYVATVGEAVGNIKEGKLNALAVTAKSRLSVLPDVPTTIEAGFTGLSPLVTWGFVVPKRTPAPIVRQLHEAIAKAVAAPATQERLHAMSITADVRDGSALTASIQSELSTWRQVIKAANIQSE